MNYKRIGKDLAHQERKGTQWYIVPHDELVRLALIGCAATEAARQAEGKPPLTKEVAEILAECFPKPHQA